MAANGDIVLTPNVMWAQRKDSLYITICVGDLKDDKKINITEDQLTLSATSQTGNKKYSVTLDFYAPIVPSKTKKMFTDRELVFLLYKKTQADVDSASTPDASASKRPPVQGFWPRILVEKKYHWLKTDFNRWKDEDDVDTESGGNDFGGDDMFGGGGFGGGGGGFGGNQDLSSMMQQMEGFNPNGMGGDDAGLEDENAEPDSDDEELPDLQA